VRRSHGKLTRFVAPGRSLDQEECGQTLCDRPDRPPHRWAQRGAEGIVLELDADQGHITGKLAGKVLGYHIRRKGVGRDAETGRVLPGEPADRAGGLPHLGRVHQDDEIGGEAADRTGHVLGRGAGLDHQERNGNGPGSVARPGPLSSEERARNFDPGRVVALELVPDSDDYNPRRWG
jgi:hypothetical protein